MKTVFNLQKVAYEKQPMFLGEDMGIQRYDRFKYQKFYDLFLKQEEQHWMPFEISLQKDRVDYENLTKEEKFIFESNLRWQTMTDSMLSRSIHEMSKYITLPELEICVNSWARFECIHSLSYTWILQNITKDAGAFFDSITDDEQIVSRAKQIAKSYDELLGGGDDIKQNLFDAVLSTQITEGLSFYTSFACAFYFGYRGKMVGNADIIKLIHKDESLHVAITQNIMKYWKENPDEGFQHIITANEAKVYAMYELAVKNEKEWADYLFSNGGLVGLNAEVLKGYIEWLANARLTSLGYKKIFQTKTNPIGGWLDAYLDEKRLQVAPQEKEITTYKIGARNTNISDGAFDGFVL